MSNRQIRKTHELDIGAHKFIILVQRRRGPLVHFDVYIFMLLSSEDFINANYYFAIPNSS